MTGRRLGPANVRLTEGQGVWAQAAEVPRQQGHLAKGRACEGASCVVMAREALLRRSETLGRTLDWVEGENVGFMNRGLWPERLAEAGMDATP